MVAEFFISIDNSEAVDWAQFTVAGVPILDFFGQEEIVGSDFSSERIFGDTEKGISVGVGVVESKIFVDI